MVRLGLLAARHGPVGPDWVGRCYGVADARSIIGPAEAAARIMGQIDGPLAAVHSSPLSRCSEPAAHIAAALGVPHRVDDRLRELDHGVFEGRLWDEIHREDPGALAAWGDRWLHEGPPGGESALQLEERVRSWLGTAEGVGPLENAAQGAAGNAAAGAPLLVAHAGVLRALTVIGSGASWGAAMGAKHKHLDLVTFA